MFFLVSRSVFSTYACLRGRALIQISGACSNQYGNSHAPLDSISIQFVLNEAPSLEWISLELGIGFPGTSPNR
jgi:hypothetical protein